MQVYSVPKDVKQLFELIDKLPISKKEKFLLLVEIKKITKEMKSK